MAAESERFVSVDLTGARFQKVHLNDARLRMVDLSGAILRDVSLVGAAIDGAELDGLTINGVEVGPLVNAELDRRQPARVLRRSAEPENLRAAWTSVEQSWSSLYQRVERLPAGTVDISVGEEWSFAQTLRHLIFATDSWLGAIRGDPRPFHPWGLPFSDIGDFFDPAEIGIDSAARPDYPDVLALRAERVAQVRDFLAQLTPAQLTEQCAGPRWDEGRTFSVLTCIRIILNEECEHQRFAERDLAVVGAGAAADR